MKQERNDVTQAERYDSILETVDPIVVEVLKAENKYPAFNSAHEGFAVLLEEVDELWDEVKVKQGKRDVAAMRLEAVQVAAMAIRFLRDVCDFGGQN